MGIVWTKAWERLIQRCELWNKFPNQVDRIYVIDNVAESLWSLYFKVFGIKASCKRGIIAIHCDKDGLNIASITTNDSIEKSNPTANVSSL